MDSLSDMFDGLCKPTFIRLIQFLKYLSFGLLFEPENHKPKIELYRSLDRTATQKPLEQN